MMFASLFMMAALLPDDQAACPAGTQDFYRKKALPPAVLAVITKPMADVDQPYTPIDAFDPEGPPQAKFIIAHQVGCKLTIEYLQGGRTVTHETMILDLGPSGWVVEAQAKRG